MAEKGWLFSIFSATVIYHVRVVYEIANKKNKKMYRLKNGLQSLSSKFMWKLNFLRSYRYFNEVCNVFYYIRAMPTKIGYCAECQCQYISLE